MQVLFTILTCGWIILCDILYSYKAFLMTEWNNWMKQLNEWMKEIAEATKGRELRLKKTKLEKEWTFHKCNRSIRLFLYIYICMHTHNTFILFPLSLNVWFIYYENQNHNSNPVHTEIIKPDQQQQQQQIYLVS